ncbi:MAG TPA: substrate-binding domain-containing protein [Candidatus Limnocylindrales bacterium]|nr:substrate-binding domain-containing protein [Candidatus Limnocylindrales bacterium]
MSSTKDQDSASVSNRLAEVRRKRGIAAAVLAREAGVSRQTIYAMEAGDYVPNTVVALRLARILEVSVEELFRLQEAAAVPKRVRAEVIGEASAGMPMELCRVEGRLVAVPAVPAPSQFLPADALSLGGREVQLLGGDPGEMRLLLAGCDPASGILGRHLAREGVGLVTAPVNSSTALRLVAKKLAHVAGTHLAGGTSKRGSAVFAFARWEQGLVVASGNPLGIRSPADLARRGLRFANRETGSGSRQLLDRVVADAGIAPARIHGYDHAPARGHVEAAWRVYAGLADCCVATRSAALAFGLDFVPLTSERYDFVIPEAYLELTPVQRLLDVLAQSALRRELEVLCGYDARETGARLNA